MSREHRAPMCCCCRKDATFAKSEYVGNASEPSGLVTMYYCVICTPTNAVKLPDNVNDYSPISGLFNDLTDTLEEVLRGGEDSERVSKR